MNGTRTLIKWTPVSSLPPPAKGGHSERTAVYEPEEGLHQPLNVLVL